MRKLFNCFGVLLLMGCSDRFQDAEVLDTGYDYLPLAIGDYRMYEVQEILYHTQGADTARFFLKQTVTDSMVSGDGTVSYVLTSVAREDTLSDWDPYRVSTARKDPYKAVITEDNTAFIKLSFPVEAGRTWNGNAQSPLDPQYYFYEDVDPDTYELTDAVSGLLGRLEGGFIKVVISDIPRNLVEQDQRYEVYMEGVGLIEKYYLTLNFCTVDCDEVAQIESGRFFSQKLIGYGQE